LKDELVLIASSIFRARDSRHLPPGMLAFAISTAVSLTASHLALAQESNDRPVLEELDRETRQLIQESDAAVVRMQLPTAQPAAAAAELLKQWQDRLSPEFRKRLEDEVKAESSPATRPAPAQVAPGPEEIHRRVITIPVISFNAIGIVVDEQGHVMVPAYVSKEMLNSRPVNVVLSNGALVPGEFVGSDPKTNVSVFQLRVRGLHPMPLGVSRPAEGQLVLMLPLDPTQSHLTVWSKWSVETGLVASMDGTIVGYASGGRFFAPGVCEPVIHELIEMGRVDRAYLGVLIQTVGPDDLQRMQDPVLGQTPAIRVEKVMPDSAADHAGVRPGDLIVSLAGQPVGDQFSFGAAIAERRGSTEMEVLRNGQRITITANLQVASSQNNGANPSPPK